MGTISHIFSCTITNDAATPNIVNVSDWNNTHVYTMQDAVSLTGNTAGVMSNVSSGTFYLAGGTNITLSQNANSVTISASTCGTISMWPDVLPGSTVGSTYYSGSTDISISSATTNYAFSIYIVPIILQYPVAFSVARMPISNGTAAGTGSVTHVYSIGFYTNNASTLSKVCDYYAGIYLSQNSSNAWTYSVWTASTGANTIIGPFGGLAAFSIRSSQGNVNSSLQINGSYKNMLFYSNSAFTTLTEGNYWFAYANCSVSSSGNVYSGMSVMQSNAISSVPLLQMGVNTSATANSLPGWGAISTTFSSASDTATWFPLPNAIAFSNMTSNSTSVLRYHFPILRGI